MNDSKNIAEDFGIRDARLREALDFGILHSPAQSALSALHGALGCLAADETDWRAINMVNTGLAALMLKTQDERRAVNEWHALSNGCDPGQDPIAILDLEQAVATAAHLRDVNDPRVTPRGPAAIEHLRVKFLVGRCGEHTPSLDQMREWFEQYASGRITMTGLVARIIECGRMYGAPGQAPETNLKRVDRIMARAAARNPKRRRILRKV